MPRPWEEMVEDFPDLSDKKWYRVLIREVDYHRAIVLTLEFLDEPQAGREHVQILRTPLHPTGIPAACFQAAGLNFQTGRKVAPEQLQGHIVSARFARGTAAEWIVVGFKPILKETRHESSTEPQSPGVSAE